MEDIVIDILKYISKNIIVHILSFQVIALYISGTLNTILSEEHRKEMIRYFYNHQVSNQTVKKTPNAQCGNIGLFDQ